MNNHIDGSLNLTSPESRPGDFTRAEVKAIKFQNSSFLCFFKLSDVLFNLTLHGSYLRLNYYVV